MERISDVLIGLFAIAGGLFYVGSELILNEHAFAKNQAGKS